MVRGDRLSNPSAFLYDEGTVLGFGAAPYWVRDGAKKQAWSADGPLQAEAFYQYAGYCCDIEKEIDGEVYAAVGYTLGYENAPWLLYFRKLKRALPGPFALRSKAPNSS